MSKAAEIQSSIQFRSRPVWFRFKTQEDMIWDSVVKFQIQIQNSWRYDEIQYDIHFHIQIRNSSRLQAKPRICVSMQEPPKTGHILSPVSAEAQDGSHNVHPTCLSHDSWQWLKESAGESSVTTRIMSPPRYWEPSIEPASDRSCSMKFSSAVDQDEHGRIANDVLQAMLHVPVIQNLRGWLWLMTNQNLWLP